MHEKREAAVTAQRADGYSARSPPPSGGRRSANIARSSRKPLEVEHLKERVAELDDELTSCHAGMSRKEEKSSRQQRAEPSTAPNPESLKRTRGEIEARMRSFLEDAQLSTLSDREIAQRSGVAPTTVGNWRRRLDAEKSRPSRLSMMDAGASAA